MNNYKDFVRRVITGGASHEEVTTTMARVAAELQEALPEADENEVADLLSVLSYANGTSFQPLVENFLSGPKTTPAIVALSILCYFYGLTEQYVGKIVELMRGVPWDPFDSVQMAATQAAGWYLREHKELNLLRELIRIVDDDKEKVARRLDAFRAIANAMGLDVDMIMPRWATRFGPEISVQSEIMRTARERLTRDETNNKI